MKNLLQSLSDTKISSLLNRAEKIWRNCECCPRKCSLDRALHTPPCNAVNDGIKVASFAVHDGEEPPVSGWNGAGNIFFSGCTLKCVYCQNWPISHENNGRVYSKSEFCDQVRIMLKKKVHNINLVTSDHYLYPVLDALISMKKEINVPIVYNCSGYFAEEALEIVLEFADVFLYDVKYIDESIASRYSKSPGYVEADWRGLEQVFSKKILWIEDELGLLKRGLILRHLVIPGALENSLSILDKLAGYMDSGHQFKLSLMSQYFPAYNAEKYPEISRRLTEEEYGVVAERMDSLGIDGWIQGF